MKLYDVPRNSKIRVLQEQQGPPGVEGFIEGETLIFHHIDGMYSVCTDETGDIYHISASEEVEIKEQSNELL
jgi:antirestriction protein